MTKIEKLEKRVQELESILKAEQQHIKRLYEIIDRTEGRDRVEITLGADKAFIPAKGFQKNAPAICGNCEYWIYDVVDLGRHKTCRIDGRRREEGDVCNILETKMDCEMRPRDK